MLQIAQRAVANSFLNSVTSLIISKDLANLLVNGRDLQEISNDLEGFAGIGADLFWDGTTPSRRAIVSKWMQIIRADQDMVLSGRHRVDSVLSITVNI